MSTYVLSSRLCPLDFLPIAGRMDYGSRDLTTMTADFADSFL